MTNKLNFTINKTKWAARTGTIELNGVTMQTPVFMPVGTKWTVKWVHLDMLNDPNYIWEEIETNIILGNTFHLYLQPGDQLIKKAGGLHKFINRDKLILTDSGGFQIFSLWLGNKKNGSKMVKIFDDHVDFRDPKNGAKHTFTPTGTVDVQSNFGSDIMMMLDVCAPTHDTTKDVVAKYMNLTHKRAKEQFDYHTSIYNDVRGALFPIVQWWLYEDLREESLAVAAGFARDGIAIWGLSVGESKEDMNRMLKFLSDKMPVAVPRYLMWVGTPEDLEYGILNGIDMFDCVLPTRLGRHGVAMAYGGNIKIRNAQYREDFGPLVEWCTCHACRNHTRAYIHHLIHEDEMIGGILLSLHNVSYLHQITNKMRKYINS